MVVLIVLMGLVSAVVATEAGMTPEVLALAEWVAAASPEELATGVSGDLAVMSPAAAAHLLAGLALAAEGMRALKVATVALAERPTGLKRCFCCLDCD